jgi:hypothetical protein
VDVQVLYHPDGDWELVGHLEAPAAAIVSPLILGGAHIITAVTLQVSNHSRLGFLVEVTAVPV